MSQDATNLASLPRHAAGPRSPGWWGIVMLMVTEGCLFAYFLTAYFTLRFRADIWPPAGIQRPELLIPAINTGILILSSVPMYWADHSMRHGGHQGRMKLGLALSFLLGAIFLIIQVWKALQWPFTPATHAYASIFIGLTVFHGAHVVAGLVMNAVTQLLAWLGYFNQHRRLGVQVTGLYWHFVDVVWVVVFLTIHVSPYITFP